MSQAKVLVIRLSSLGDVVHATAALAPLRAASAEISMVTKATFAPLLEGHPDLRTVYAFRKLPSERESRAAFYTWFHSQGFTHVLDLHDSWRSRLWRRELAKSAVVEVARKPRLREWLILILRLGPWLGFGAGGRARLYQDAAERLASKITGKLQTFPLQTKLQVHPSDKDKVANLKPNGSYWVFLPGSAWRQKIWPYYRELAARAQVPVLVLGGDGDFECDAIAAAAKIAGSKSLRGKTDLRQSMALLAEASWIIGNDTGLVHVAESLGKNVAMIEGPTHSFMGFSPFHTTSLRLGLPLLCRPCSKNGRICWRFGLRTCLRGLSVEQVGTALREAGYPC